VPGPDPVESYFGRREQGFSDSTTTVPTDAVTRSELARWRKRHYHGGPMYLSGLWTLDGVQHAVLVVQ